MQPYEYAEAATRANEYPKHAYGHPRPKDFDAKRKAYTVREGEIRTQFAVDLAQQYLPPELSKRVTDAVFWKAWEDGHASGYRSVEDIYEDLAELATLVFEEGVQHEKDRQMQMARDGGR